VGFVYDSVACEASEALRRERGKGASIEKSRNKDLAVWPDRHREREVGVAPDEQEVFGAYQVLLGSTGAPTVSAEPASLSLVCSTSDSWPIAIATASANASE
jgi:hypothetical protein